MRHLTWSAGLVIVLIGSSSQAQQAAQTNSTSSLVDTTSLARLQEIVTQLGGHHPKADSLRLALRSVVDTMNVSACRDKLEGFKLITSRSFGRCLWGSGDVSAANLANITANSDGGSVYADVLSAFFGPVRLNFGTLVSGATQDKEPDATGREALQRLVAGGGNLLIGLQWPAVQLKIRRFNNMTFTSAGLVRGATNVEALGASQNTKASTGAAAVDGRLRFTSDGGELELFGYLRREWVAGDQPLISNTATSSPDAIEIGNAFNYWQASFGARLWQEVLIVWTHYACSTCAQGNVRNQLSITAQRKAP